MIESLGRGPEQPPEQQLEFALVPSVYEWRNRPSNIKALHIEAGNVSSTAVRFSVKLKPSDANEPLPGEDESGETSLAEASTTELPTEELLAINTISQPHCEVDFTPQKNYRAIPILAKYNSLPAPIKKQALPIILGTCALAFGSVAAVKATVDMFKLEKEPVTTAAKPTSEKPRLDPRLASPSAASAKQSSKHIKSDKKNESHPSGKKSAKDSARDNKSKPQSDKTRPAKDEPKNKTEQKSQGANSIVPTVTRKRVEPIRGQKEPDRPAPKKRPQKRHRPSTTLEGGVVAPPLVNPPSQVQPPATPILQAPLTPGIGYTAPPAPPPSIAQP